MFMIWSAPPHTHSDGIKLESESLHSQSIIQKLQSPNAGRQQDFSCLVFRFLNANGSLVLACN